MWLLKEGQIERCRRSIAQAAIFRVADNSNNLKPALRHASEYAADRVASTENSSHKCLIDQRYRGTAFAVVPCDFTSGNQRYAHRFEELWRDELNRGFLLLFGFRNADVI